MWKCPKCETINDSEICVICGEPKPLPVPEPTYKVVPVPKRPPEPPRPAVAPVKKRRSGLKVVLVLCAVAVLAVSATVLSLEYMRMKALNALNFTKYDKAISYASKISFYRDAKDIWDRAVYEKAKDLIYDGEYDEAIEELLKIPDHEDSETLQIYAKAEKEYERENFIAAYYDFLEISDYGDVPEILEELKEEMYYEGVNLYDNGYYGDASEYFEILAEEDYKDSDYYLYMTGY